MFALALALGRSAGSTGGAASGSGGNTTGTPGVGVPQPGEEEEPEDGEGSAPGERRWYAVWSPTWCSGVYYGRWGSVRAHCASQGEVWGKRRGSEEECRRWLRDHRHHAAAAKPVVYLP